jgi:hypothetical protein
MRVCWIVATVNIHAEEQQVRKMPALGELLKMKTWWLHSFRELTLPNNQSRIKKRSAARPESADEEAESCTACYASLNAEESVSCAICTAKVSFCAHLCTLDCTSLHFDVMKLLMHRYIVLGAAHLRVTSPNAHHAYLQRHSIPTFRQPSPRRTKTPPLRSRPSRYLRLETFSRVSVTWKHMQQTVASTATGHMHLVATRKMGELGSCAHCKEYRLLPVELGKGKNSRSSATVQVRWIFVSEKKKQM